MGMGAEPATSARAPHWGCNTHLDQNPQLLPSLSPLRIAGRPRPKAVRGCGHVEFVKRVQLLPPRGLSSPEHCQVEIPVPICQVVLRGGPAAAAAAAAGAAGEEAAMRGCAHGWVRARSAAPRDTTALGHTHSHTPHTPTVATVHKSKWRSSGSDSPADIFLARCFPLLLQKGCTPPATACCCSAQRQRAQSHV